MYKDFYSLKSNPFGSGPDPRFLYMTSHTREALAGLEYGISSRKGIVVLTGEVGTGKTTLLRSALSALGSQRFMTSFVFNPRFDVLDFLEFVLSDFGFTPTVRTKSAMLLQLTRWFMECYQNGQICVLVVDEAQNCSWDLLEEIRLMTNVETSSEKLVQVVLSGQPELEDKLRQANARQLRQRVALWCRTYPLSEPQTQEYVVERLRMAGREEMLFEPEAVTLIAQGSQGIPRLINLVCDHCLLLGYVQQKRTIGPEVVEAVAKDLDLESYPRFSSYVPDEPEALDEDPGYAESEASGYAEERSEDAMDFGSHPYEPVSSELADQFAEAEFEEAEQHRGEPEAEPEAHSGDERPETLHPH